MTQRDVEPTGQRPVAMGCSLAVLTVVLSVIAVGGCIAFAESGANTGKITLRDADSYDYDSVDFNGANNFYLVRTPSGQLVAFSDLDVANRSNSARQCRVIIVHPQAPEFVRLSDEFEGRFSSQAGSSPTMFREACNDAVYDLAGVRIDEDGRNLDQFSVTIDRQNRVVVDISRRICTARELREFRLPATC